MTPGADDKQEMDKSIALLLGHVCEVISTNTHVHTQRTLTNPIKVFQSLVCITMIDHITNR